MLKLNIPKIMSTVCMDPNRTYNGEKSISTESKSSDLNLKDIIIGQPKVMSTICMDPNRTKIENKNELEIDSPLDIKDIIKGIPRLLRTHPGDPKREELIKPHISIIDMLQNWDNVNINHYYKVCQMRIILGVL